MPARLKHQVFIPAIGENYLLASSDQICKYTYDNLLFELNVSE